MLKNELLHSDRYMMVKQVDQWCSHFGSLVRVLVRGGVSKM